MKKAAGILIGVFIFLLAVIAFKDLAFGYDKMNVSNYYLQKALNNTGSANIVTSIVLGFRAFDTLGELLVLFAASLGVGVVLGNSMQKNSLAAPSLILSFTVDALFPFLVVFGIYVFLYGHISPGGGFQAGAIFASAFLYKFLGGKRAFSLHTSEYIEG